jgi:uncharacterized protein DUF6049
MPSVRTLVRTLIAGFLALAGPVLAAFGVPAHAQVTEQSARTAAAVSHSLTVTIDKVTPSVPGPNSTITVSGTLTNDTGSTVSGLGVQLLSSSQVFRSRSEMDAYMANGSGVIPVSEGTPVAVTATLRNGGTVRWSASFTAASAIYGQFGVYPLIAQAVSMATYQQLTGAAERTLLPYWPGNGSAQPLKVAWVWPLIDVPQQDRPQQGSCSQTLDSASLATSLGTSGRLGTLLSTGLRWAGKTDLTWAVDPALLSDATVMTHAYKVGGSYTCHGTTPMPASAAASSWLGTLRQGTANQPMFLTPYADVDVAALSHAGLDTDLRTAYTIGESVAGKDLHRSFGTNGTGTGADGSASVAWPADGTADASVLTSLARNAGISTVVLNSDEMPPAASSSFSADTAVTSVTTGIGGTMHVLLADSQLTSVLGSASASSSAGAQFAAEQEFLAQTAMISAELPRSSRSLVIVPPRRWDPSAAEASALLSLTTQAPWLRPVSLSSLASSGSSYPVSRQALPGNKVSSAELSGSYLGQVKSVDADLALYKNLLYRPGPNALRTLDAAAAVTESSAWRGNGGYSGQFTLARLSGYLRDNEHEVQIITGKKVLLAGTSGDTPVSVQNGLGVPVQVQVAAILPNNSQLTVDKAKFDSLIMVPAGKTGTVRMPVHSSALGTTTLQLQLQTRNGSPLTWTSQSLSIQVTRYGRALLVLIAAALGVLVLTSVARWIRQWLNDGGAHARSGGTG